MAIVLIQLGLLLSSFFITQTETIYFISKFVKVSTEQLNSLTQFLNPSFFLRLRAASVLNVLLVVILFYTVNLNNLKFSCINLTASIQYFFRNTALKIYAIVFLLMVLKIVLSMLVPLTTDELFNFNNYVVNGPLVSLSFGIGPNNHVLHTFLMALVYALTGWAKFSIRIVELVVLAFFFLFFLKKYAVRLGWLKSVFVVVILNFSIDFYWQSTISRGYCMLFVFAFAYLYYSFSFLHNSEKNNLIKAEIFGVLAACVLPTFCFLPAAMLLLVLITKKELFTVFLKTNLIILAIALVFYEPIIIFSGRNFLFGNNWIHSSSNFNSQFYYLLTELLALSGFGSWALGLCILSLQLFHLKKEPIALLGLLLWLLIGIVSLISQYAAPVRVYIILLSVSFFFISEIITEINRKSILFVLVLMLVVFVHNYNLQITPVYQRYQAMERLFKNQFEGKIFTNNDLYFNKAKYLQLTENYPQVIYATGRISKLKYLILKTETKLSETTLEEYQLMDSNKEVNLYKRKK